jgi:hypothetical protein
MGLLFLLLVTLAAADSLAPVTTLPGYGIFFFFFCFFLFSRSQKLNWVSKLLSRHPQVPHVGWKGHYQRGIWIRAVYVGFWF